MTKKLWGGRFTKESDKEFFDFQKSIGYDYKLAKYDIFHSLLHIYALWEEGLLTPLERNRLYTTLQSIPKNIVKSKLGSAEDIHTYIQNKVEKKVKKLALKLHTLRSRNDQIVFDEKMYCYYEAYKIKKLLDNILGAIDFLKKKYKKFSIIGYTHTQRAQKVYFEDYIGAYGCMFKRDKKRISIFQKNLIVHIGAGALAGSSIAKKNYLKAIRKLLEDKNIHIKPSVNTLDDVSDRDFIIELLSILAILQMHLSRLAEDLILYSTKEFNFVKLPEEFCTGSSLMPHKKNPDFLELVRGYSGKIYGNLVSILTTMKGLPLTYNRDMQLDKEPLFSSVETVVSEISIMIRFLKGLELNKDAVRAARKDEALRAVKKADNLVRQKGISFKKAHDNVGRETSVKERLEELISKLPIGRKIELKESLEERLSKLPTRKEARPR